MYKSLSYNMADVSPNSKLNSISINYSDRNCINTNSSTSVNIDIVTPASKLDSTT
jgi:hypothetical protein